MPSTVADRIASKRRQHLVNANHRPDRRSRATVRILADEARGAASPTAAGGFLHARSSRRTASARRRLSCQSPRASRRLGVRPVTAPSAAPRGPPRRRAGSDAFARTSRAADPLAMPPAPPRAARTCRGTSARSPASRNGRGRIAGRCARAPCSATDCAQSPAGLPGTRHTSRSRAPRCCESIVL